MRNDKKKTQAQGILRIIRVLPAYGERLHVQ